MRQGLGNRSHDDQLHVQFIVQTVLPLWFKKLDAILRTSEVQFVHAE